MWLIGTLMNCSDGSMAQEQHRDVTPSGAPGIIPGLNRIGAERSTERSMTLRRSSFCRPSDKPSAGTTPRGCAFTTGLVHPVYVTVTF
jgi:hypothetical protein